MWQLVDCKCVVARYYGESIEYLQKLRGIHDSPLYRHRRTLVIGFIVALKCQKYIFRFAAKKRKPILILF